MFSLNISMALSTLPKRAGDSTTFSNCSSVKRLKNSSLRLPVFSKAAKYSFHFRASPSPGFTSASGSGLPLRTARIPFVAINQMFEMIHKGQPLRARPPASVTHCDMAKTFQSGFSYLIGKYRQPFALVHYLSNGFLNGNPIRFQTKEFKMPALSFFRSKVFEQS